MQSLRAARELCPLRLDHPPNGIEFGLGCGLCMDKKGAKTNLEQPALLIPEVEIGDIPPDRV